VSPYKPALAVRLDAPKKGLGTLSILFGSRRPLNGSITKKGLLDRSQVSRAIRARTIGEMGSWAVTGGVKKSVFGWEYSSECWHEWPPSVAR
jgi:hypothetical protein